MRRMKKVVASCIIAAMMATSLVGCGATNTAIVNNVSAEEQMEADIQDVDDAASLVVGDASVVGTATAADGSETVYVIMDADGNETEKLVSRAVKGEDGSTQYIQENATKELPVTVKVKYELDGQKVSAAELAGKSGHLVITFSYVNNMSKEVEINGKKETIYQPFTMLSGVIFDNEKAKNVSVTNGQVIDNGDSSVVAGVALPGLSESLGLDEYKDKVDFEIPEEVVIEADVTDFEMMMTITAATNNALSTINLDDVDTLDDLKANIADLTDGMSQLKDGSSDLADGAVQLNDGANSLADGAAKLNEGASSLSDGAVTLQNGISQVDTGATQLKDGIVSLQSNIPALSSGVSDLHSGTTALSNGADELTSYNESLQSGADALDSGLAQLNGALSSEESQAQMVTLVQGSATFGENLDNAASGLDQIVAGYNPDSEQLAAMLGYLEATANATLQNPDATQAELANAQYTLALVDTYKGLYQNTSKVSSGVDALNENYSQIDGGINQVAGSMSDIQSAVGQLSTGASQLNTGVDSYVEGVNNLSGGIKQVDSGVGKLEGSIPALTSGVNQLTDGSVQLATGTSQLTSGSSQLATGAKTLSSGTSDLYTGAKTLAEGTAALKDGSLELKDGLVKFDEEGIQKLASLVNDDLQSFYDRLMAVKDYAGEYTSYTGNASSSDGSLGNASVKFIYKTDEIKK